MIKDEKRLFLFAGPNGSGKSTVAKQFIDRKQCPSYYICPDVSVDKRRGNIEEAYIDAMNIAEESRYSALDNGLSFSFETVFSRDDKLDFLKYAKKCGYIITSMYITTSNPKINIERIYKRFKEGGHFVPEDKVKSRYERSMNLLPDVLRISDNAFVYDNDGYPFQMVLNMDKDRLDINRRYLTAPWTKKYIFDKITDICYEKEVCYI